MKIFAGLKLKGKNPRHAPATRAQIRLTSYLPILYVMKNMEMAHIIETPDANPSSPSIKLIVFVIPQTQKIVTGMDKIFKISRAS